MINFNGRVLKLVKGVGKLEKGAAEVGKMLGKGGKVLAQEASEAATISDSLAQKLAEIRKTKGEARAAKRANLKNVIADFTYRPVVKGGKAFGKGCIKAYNKVVDGIKSVPAKLQRVGDNIGRTVENYNIVRTAQAEEIAKCNTQQAQLSSVSKELKRYNRTDAVNKIRQKRIDRIQTKVNQKRALQKTRQENMKNVLESLKGNQAEAAATME